MIECRDITKIYKTGSVETKVLKGISFLVEKGEFVAIMGPSGTGKSTLMNILGCLDTPTAGQYFFEGKDISKFSDNELADIRKKKIGFVFQSFNLLARTTVLKNVMLPLIINNVPFKEREKIAKDALKSVGINEEHFYHLSNQLSGGQMQRVAIARALVNNPPLILADEPTGNLDSKTGEIVLNIFHKLNRDGRTIILITHEKYIAEQAKRIIFIRDGKIIEDTLSHLSKEAKYVKE